MKKVLLVLTLGLVIYAGSHFSQKQVASDVTPLWTCPGGNGGTGGNCSG